MLDKLLNTRFITSLLIIRFAINYLVLPRLATDANLSSQPLAFCLSILSTGLLIAALILALIWLGKIKSKD